MNRKRPGVNMLIGLLCLLTLITCCNVDGCRHCWIISSSRCWQCQSGNQKKDDSCCSSSLSNCDTCFGDHTQCDACISDTHLLISGNCDTACSDVMTECDRCSSVNTCTDCGDDTWVLNSTNFCQKCDSLMYQCERCSSVSTCSSCYAQHSFNSTGQCQLCSQMFSDCQECQTLTCTTCVNSTLFVNGSGECQLCSLAIPGCLTCSDISTCTQCLNDSFIPNTTTGGCVPCVDYLPFCDICDSTSSCVTCQNDSSIVMTSYSQCVQCGYPMPQCIECTSQTFCTLCAPLHVLRVGIYSECHSCSSLMFGCHNCTRQDTCTSCYVGESVNFGCSTTPGCLSVFISPSASVCSTCDPQYFYSEPVDGQCQCLIGHLAQNYCTTIVGCTVAVNGTEGVYCGSCDIMKNFQLVNRTCQCVQNYTLQGSTCVDICGDGYLITLSCDDGNTIDGDGCSSSCQVQDNYRCLIHDGSTQSTCVYAARIQLVLSSINKQGQANSFKAVFTTQPQIDHLNRSDFTDALQLGIDGRVTFDRYQFDGPLITAYFDYLEDIDGKAANFSIIYDPFVVRHPSQTIFFELYDSSGVPLKFSQTNEGFKQLSQNLLLALSATVLMLLLVSSWAHRMIGLEAVYTVQMVRVMQVLVTNYYPHMNYFTKLNLALGRLDLFLDSQSTTNSDVKAYEYLTMGQSFVYNYQFPLLLQIAILGLFACAWIIRTMPFIVSQPLDNKTGKEKGDCFIPLTHFFYYHVLFPFFIGFLVLMILSMNMDRGSESPSIIASFLTVLVYGVSSIVAFWQFIIVFRTHQTSDQAIKLKCSSNYPALFVLMVYVSSILSHLAISQLFPYATLTLSGWILVSSVSLFVFQPYRHKIHQIGLGLNNLTLILMASWLLIDQTIGFSDSIVQIMTYALVGLLATVTLWTGVRLMAQLCCNSSVQLQEQRNLFFAEATKRTKQVTELQVRVSEDLLTRQLEKQRRKGINPYELLSQNLRHRQKKDTPIHASKFDNKLPNNSIYKGGRISIEMIKISAHYYELDQI